METGAVQLAFIDGLSHGFTKRISKEFDEGDLTLEGPDPTWSGDFIMLILGRTLVKKTLSLVALALLATVIVAETAFAGKCPPGQRFYNGRCV